MQMDHDTTIARYVDVVGKQTCSNISRSIVFSLLDYIHILWQKDSYPFWK